MSIDIQHLKEHINSDLKAEVLFYELQNMLKTESKVFGKFVGISKRNKSKDIVDISTILYQDETGYTNESVVLHISKNSLFHNLPEILFFPLSISNSNMSNKEIVEAVKKNKTIENNALDFFMPIDNQLFEINLELINRSIHIYNDKKKLYLNIIDELLAIDYEISDLQKQNLFIVLTDGDKMKENLPKIENFLKLMLENEVKINYKKHIIQESPYKALGSSLLGVDFGLCGMFESELDDVDVVFYFEGKIDYTILTKKIKLTTKILEYFLISARKINISFFNNYQLGIKLNENYLGINTII